MLTTLVISTTIEVALQNITLQATTRVWAKSCWQIMRIIQSTTGWGVKEELRDALENM